MDYKKYQKIQQTIIDTLDTCEWVEIKGKGENETDLLIHLHTLTDAKTQTNFENCVADVNIPLGEVFTSPVLAGTGGMLHVSKVYLNGLQFCDLKLVFDCGQVIDYSCSNFETEEENRKYIEDNILFHHPKLAMGEFAIGTNTTAYVAAQKYNIADKLPILILAVYSFTDAANIGPFRSFSVHNYVTLFTTPELLNMILGSVILAVGSGLIATILGTSGAIGAFYSKKRVKTAMSALNQVPVVNADVVTGFSMCILLVVVFGVSKDTYIPLVLGHVVLSAPFVYLAVVPKLKQMDPSIYEAALDLGATPFYALVKVIIPEIASGILSGFVMAITLSLDDYFVATYTKPATFDTISTYVVNATKGSQTEIKTALWALSTIIFLVVVVVELVLNLAPAKKAAGEETEIDE